MNEVQSVTEPNETIRMSDIKYSVGSQGGSVLDGRLEFDCKRLCSPAAVVTGYWLVNLCRL